MWMFGENTICFQSPILTKKKNNPLFSVTVRQKQKLPRPCCQLTGNCQHCFHLGGNNEQKPEEKLNGNNGDEKMKMQEFIGVSQNKTPSGFSSAVLWGK